MEYIIHPDFPNSQSQPFIKTSEETGNYNCIAHAVGEDKNIWYEPENPVKYGSTWPENVPLEYTENAFMQFFVYFGYKSCDNGNIELGFEKIAFFRSNEDVDSWWSFHAAKQLPNGEWSSKLGDGIDVSHTLEAFMGGIYGDIIKFFKRPK